MYVSMYVDVLGPTQESLLGSSLLMFVYILTPSAHPAAASCRAILAYDIKNTSRQHVDQILALAGPATVWLFLSTWSRWKSLSSPAVVRTWANMCDQYYGTWSGIGFVHRSPWWMKVLWLDAEITPLWVPCAKECREHWAPTFWELHRVWCDAWLTCRLSILRFDSCHFPVILAQCPLCGCGAVGLKHFVENCVAKAGLREDLDGDGPISLHWALSTTAFLVRSFWLAYPPRGRRTPWMLRWCKILATWWGWNWA